MYHERLTVEDCIKRFPIELLVDLRTRRNRTIDLGRFDPFRVDLISCDQNVAELEYVRSKVREIVDLGPAIPTDVFLWNDGEGDNRTITKAGGLPYWPKNKPWPLDKDGKKMTFCAQVNFCDSRDLVGDSHGDILLVFVMYDEDYSSPNPYEDYFVQLEWMTIGDHELVTQADVPDFGYPILPTHASIIRMTDYPDLWELAEKECPEVDLINLSEIESTKIGGVPRDNQGSLELPGKHLCTIGTVCGFNEGNGTSDSNALPQWIRDHRWADLVRHLMWGDMGSFNIFRTDEKLPWDWSCG